MFFVIYQIIALIQLLPGNIISFLIVLYSYTVFEAKYLLDLNLNLGFMYLSKD